ncbi:MAG: histidine kinase [Gemmatimonadaceae bacterium]
MRDSGMRDQASEQQGHHESDEPHDGAVAMDEHTFDPEGVRDEPVDWRYASLVAVGACLLLGVLETINALVIRYIDGKPRDVWFTVREQTPWWLLWMIFVPGVLWLARHFRFDDTRWRRSAVVHGVAAVFIGVAHGSLYGALLHWREVALPGVDTVGGSMRYFLLRYLFMDLMTYGAAVGIYYSFEYFSRFRTSVRAAEVSRAQATRLRLNLAEARLHALRMELNPHFLFNTLNAVAGLIRKREHDGAVEMLARLGELLRTTLDRDMPDEIELTRELSLLRRFVEIEMVRFGDRLRVLWEVESDVQSALVPPLILQPLVENALRHGIARRPGAALLRISARRLGDQLELEVRDTGEGLTLVNGRPPAEGIGLANTRARLEELYGARAASVELTDVPSGGARARLLLPFRAATEGGKNGDVAIGA